MVSTSGCLGWLKERTNLEKALLSLSSILLLTLLLTIIILATYQGKKANPLNDGTICWSEECQQTAEEVLKSLEPEIDACSNFYDYACGKYGLDPGQTVSVARRSTDSVYFSLKRLMESQRKFDIQGLDDVRNFYNICVVLDNHQVNKTILLNVMEEVGEYTWPILDPMYSFMDHSLERHLAHLILLDVPVVFQMEVVPDQLISGAYLVKISPGRPREIGRTPDEIREDIKLRASLLTSFFLIGSTSGITDVDDILSWDREFANVAGQDKNATCDVITLAPQEAASELQRLTDIKWDVIFSEIRNKTGLRRPFAVELHCKQKIKDYFKILEAPVEKSVSNYLGWRLFSEFEKIVIPTFQFETGKPHAARWRVCLEHMEKFFSPIFADLLSREIVDKDVQEEVERMSNATLSAAKLLVSRASWLSDVQKSRIQDKVSRIRIRYPYKRLAHYGDAAQIDVPKVNCTNFTQVVIHRQREEMIQRFRRLFESSGQAGSWKPVLTEVDHSEASPDSTAYIYFDKIRTPYVRQQESQWMNYGGFGIFIAREISRLLLSLNAGVGDEEKYIVWNLWSRNTNSRACLPSETRFSRAKDTFLDRSALEIAYEAAKLTAISSSKSLPGLSFSDEELFFVSYAQTTCEAEKGEQNGTRERFDRTVHNYKSFNEVFSCKSQSICQIWA